MLFLLSGEATTLFLPDPSAAGWDSQPPNREDKRFAETEFLLVDLLSGDTGLLTLAVPSPSSSSSSSSSDSCNEASRLIVDWEGSREVMDEVLVLVRRNHSSGMHIRKVRVALEEKGFGMEGNSTVLYIGESPGNLEDSV